jgi:probable F420-dependent oxidoreductase
MHLGVTMFATDKSIRPDDLAREAEARGFESLFFPEHTHIPTGRRTPYPMGGELPDEYKRTFDLFVSMTAAAAATTRLTVGSGICLVAQRDPIITAKEVASVDALSGGRVIFGIGFGWNEDEMEDHGVEPRRRRSLAREKVLAMKALWQDDEASFDGEHVHLPPTWMWPKPVQRPHPPILIGGATGPTLFRHVVEYADGWMPIGGSGLRKAVPELHRLAEEGGRDPSTITVIPFSVVGEADRLEYYASQGFPRTVLGLPSAPADVVLPLLDRYAGLLERVA